MFLSVSLGRTLIFAACLGVLIGLVLGSFHVRMPKPRDAGHLGDDAARRLLSQALHAPAAWSALVPSSSSSSSSSSSILVDEMASVGASPNVADEASPRAALPASSSSFPTVPQDTEAPLATGFDFTGTAIVTMAMGDSAGRMALALVQSLRDVGTRAADVVVMLSQGGIGSAECRHRPPAGGCGGPNAAEADIVSTPLLESLLALDVKLMVVPEIPSTQWTQGIAGGRTWFWGAALNKLRVFNLTQYRKVIWMDGDTLVLKNVDHLFREPMLTGAYTYSCCNPNAPATPSGGLWVLEPSVELGLDMWRMMVDGKPSLSDYDKGHPLLGADGVQLRSAWNWGDMQIVRWRFSEWQREPDLETWWPKVDDVRHGHPGGMRLLPKYRNMSDDEFAANSKDRHGTQLVDGFDASKWDGKTAVWHALDARYDQCAGMCECLPERDMPNDFFTVHFSCFQNGIHKPGNYENELDMFTTMQNNAMSCTRHYILAVWYEKFKRAHGRLPSPLYEGPALPIWSAEYDEIVTARRGEAKKKLV